MEGRRQPRAAASGRRDRADAGFAVENVDAVVIAEQPEAGAARRRDPRPLAGALGIEPAAVSVKGKTNEGMGETGRGEGIVVHAVALLTRRD